MWASAHPEAYISRPIVRIVALFAASLVLIIMVGCQNARQLEHAAPLTTTLAAFQRRPGVPGKTPLS